MAFVAPEQRVLIEMLLSAVFCCLPRAVKVMQQFQDSSTGMVWVECLPLVKQPISLCCHLIQGIKEQEWKGGSMDSLPLTIYLCFSKGY